MKSAGSSLEAAQVPRIIPAAPFDLAALIPEFADLARETTLLYPRSGEPGIRQSSMGGPLLWPADEPWPYCDQSGHWTYGTGAGPWQEIRPKTVPMVPVLQLFARDVPRLEFPPGKDVVQLVWCALIHEEDRAGAALPRLYWRNEVETVAAGLLDHATAPDEDECNEDFVPRSCTVCPTPVLEYPAQDLPEDLRQALLPRLEELQERFGCWYSEVACALQNKVGGYPAWTQSPDWPHCSRGHRMEHLFSITAETAYGRWLPLDEHLPGTTQPSWDAPADPGVLDTIGTDLEIGDAGGIYVFLCRQCPELPYAHRYDCH